MQYFLSSFAKRLPLIVAGDCNENETSGSAVNWLCSAAGPGLTNALPLFDQSSATWHWNLPVVGERRDRYDHIMFSEEFICGGANVVDTGFDGSDHFPVRADLFLSIKSNQQDNLGQKGKAMVSEAFTK